MYPDLHRLFTKALSSYCFPNMKIHLFNENVYFKIVGSCCETFYEVSFLLYWKIGKENQNSSLQRKPCILRKQFKAHDWACCCRRCATSCFRAEPNCPASCQLSTKEVFTAFWESLAFWLRPCLLLFLAAACTLSILCFVEISALNFGCRLCSLSHCCGADGMPCTAVMHAHALN